MNCNIIRNFLFAFVLLAASCDSGDIAAPSYAVSQSGRAVRMCATVTGVSSLDDDICVSLAVFAAGDTYATVQRTISSATPDGTRVELVLGNLGDDVATAELVLSGKLRNRLLTLFEVDLSDCQPGDTVDMDLGTLQLNLQGCVQRGVFDQTCVQCHSGSHQAAGLSLSPGQSLEQLAGVPSTAVPGGVRVVPGQPGRSVLCQVLSDNGGQVVGFNHTDLMSSQFKTNLSEVRSVIERWISSLAD